MNFQNQIDYLQLKSEDILEGVEVPAPLQAETLKTQIVFRCGLLEPVYTEPEIMQAAISQFFKREQWNITHLVNIILAEYSPIENTDRYSEHQIDREGGKKTSSSGSDTHSGKDERDLTNSGTDVHDIRHTGTDATREAHAGSDITTNTVSAFNASDYQPDSRSDLQHGEEIIGDTIYGHTINDGLIHGHRVDDDTTYGHKIDRTGSISEETSGTDKYVEHTHGNIGVTTNQEMIEQELQLLRHFDVYDWIAAKLENELFIQVY